MRHALRILTWIALALSAIVIAGCTNDEPAATASATAEASTEAGVQRSATPTSTPASLQQLGQQEYADQLCEQSAIASSRSFAAFVTAAEAYDAAAGDSDAEVESIVNWAVASGTAWLEFTDWAVAVQPPAALEPFHQIVSVSFAFFAGERSALGLEVAEATDPASVWIGAQRVWALTLLEPLSFYDAGEELPPSVQRSLFPEDCGALFAIDSPTMPAASSAEARYATQVCWLHALAWEQQQLNLQQLALAFDPTSSAETLAAIASTYARQEQRTQLLVGLGMQQIATSAGQQEFHDAAFANSSTRLVAAFDAELAIEDALTSDEVSDAVNDMLGAFSGLAAAMVTIRDDAPEALQQAIATSAPCGALDGSELAFYEALTG